MKENIKTILMLLVPMIIFSIPIVAKAQGGPGGDPDVLPVDGGISFLAAAGVAYCVKKIRDFRKKKAE